MWRAEALDGLHEAVAGQFCGKPGRPPYLTIGTLRRCRPKHRNNPYTRFLAPRNAATADCGRFARLESVTAGSLAQKHTYASADGFAKVVAHH